MPFIAIGISVFIWNHRHLEIVFKNHFTSVLGLREQIYLHYWELNIFPWFVEKQRHNTTWNWPVVTKHFVQIMRLTKIGVQNVTIYSQFSISRSLHNTGNYVDKIANVTECRSMFSYKILRYKAFSENVLVYKRTWNYLLD